MRNKLQKISMVVAAIVMFTGVMLLSVEKNEQGKWQVATVSSFAQGGESDGCPKVSRMETRTITWNVWVPYSEGLCLIVTMEGIETDCTGGPGTITCCAGIDSYRQLSSN